MSVLVGAENWSVRRLTSESRGSERGERASLSMNTLFDTRGCRLRLLSDLLVSFPRFGWTGWRGCLHRSRLLGSRCCSSVGVD